MLEEQMQGESLPEEDTGVAGVSVMTHWTSRRQSLTEEKFER